jgi:hypothetical protein
VAEIVAALDLTDPSQHGWTIDYHIRREDGQELHVEVRCWDKARDAAERAGNASALEAMADRGAAAALEAAERAPSPAVRGAVADLDLVRPRRRRKISAAGQLPRDLTLKGEEACHRPITTASTWPQRSPR